MYCFVEPLSGELRYIWPCSLAELTLVPWGIEQLDCSDNSLLPLFLVSPAINSFVSYANIHELANYCQCIYHKLNLGRSSQNKTEKEKYLARLTENIFLLIFEWPEQAFCIQEADVLVRGTSPIKRIYTSFVQMKIKQLCER